MRLSRRQLLLFFWDLLILGTAVYMAYTTRFWSAGELGLTPWELADTYTGATLAALAVHVFVFYLFDMYNPSTKYGFVGSLKVLTTAEFFALILLGAAYYFIPNWKFGRGTLALEALYIVPSITLWRVLYAKLLQKTESSRAALLVGGGESAEFFLHEVKGSVENPYNILGIVEDVKKVGTAIDGVKVIGKSDDMPELVKSNNVRTLIVSNRIRRNQALLSRIMTQKLAGVEVVDIPSAFKRATGKLPLRYIDINWLVDAQGFGTLNHPVVQKIKRLIDILASLFGLLVTMPLTVPAALLVKMTSMGPVFYRQTRVGLDEKPFVMVKFRTMVADAEKDSGPVFAQQNDARVTPIGRILRRLRVDELPQFWNVLRGDMSLIGPRPERPNFVEKYKKEIPFYSLRFAVKPGLTGWAQVAYRYGSSDKDAAEKLQYDLFYIQEMSLGLDASIYLKTMQTVVSRKGS